MDAGVQTESEVNIAAMNGNYSVFKAKKFPRGYTEFLNQNLEIF